MSKITKAHEPIVKAIVPHLSVREFAAVYGVSTMTIYRAIKAGQIEGAKKVRSQWRIPADAAFH